MHIHEINEFTIDTNTTQEIYGVFVSESNTTLKIPAFKYNDSQYKIRFSPNETGKWKFSIHINGTQGETGSIDCQQPNDKPIAGALKVLESNTHYFQRDDKPFLMNSYECDWLFALWMTDSEKAASFIDKIASYKFNSVLMNVYAHECDWTDPNTKDRLVPPPLYPWEGSNDQPNHTQLNYDFFAKLDGLVAYMHNKGIVAHLMLFVYNKLVSWPAKRSKEEVEYITHIISRYQAYSNVIWDLAKESYYIHPDITYAAEKLRDIKELDAYNRLITVHDYKELVHHSEYSKLVDFSTLQQHIDIHARGIMEHNQTGKPVFHSEFGYESGMSGLDEKTYKETLPLDDFIHRSYQALLSGAGICYYYTFTGWDVIRPDDTPDGYEAFKRIYEFFESFDWWNYSPNPDLCFWTPTMCYSSSNGEDHIINTNHHGEFLLGYDLKDYSISGTWYNMLTGVSQPLDKTEYSSYYHAMHQTVINGPFGRFSILKLTVKKR